MCVMCRSGNLLVLCAGFVAGTAAMAHADIQKGASLEGAGASVPMSYSSTGVAQGGDVVLRSGSPLFWDNGSAGNPPTGQSSEEGTAVNSSAVYDDFCVDACICLKVDRIEADFLTNSSFAQWMGATAVLYLYTDCDGCPDECVAYAFDPEVEGADSTPDSNGFRKVTYSFEDFFLCDGWDQLLDKFVLHGGACYWLSVVHIGDGSWTDRGFWCATGEEDIKAGEATFYSEFFWVPFCTPISTTNVGKTDFVFRVYGDVSYVICDNGNCATYGHPSALNTSLPTTRAADNFFVREDTILDIIKVCLINNCDPHRSFVEIFEGDCYPEGDPLLHAVDPIVVGPIGYSTGAFGQPGGDPIWELTWCIENGYLLDGCKTYWVAPVGKGTGAFGERAYFAFNSDCKDPDCLIKISEGRFLRHPNPSWEKVSTVVGEPRDFAFKVCGRPANGSAGDPDPEPTPEPTPAPDKGNSLNDLRNAIGAFGFNNGLGL